MSGVEVLAYQPEHRDAWVAMRRELFAGENEALLDEEERQIDRLGTLKGQLFARFIAFIETTPAGFAEATIRSSAEDCMTSPVVYLEAWFVADRHRGRGAGRALVAAVGAWGMSHECTEMGSDTRVQNTASTDAHLALGFEDAGVIRCFRKDLSDPV